MVSVKIVIALIVSVIIGSSFMYMTIPRNERQCIEDNDLFLHVTVTVTPSVQYVSIPHPNEFFNNETDQEEEMKEDEFVEKTFHDWDSTITCMEFPDFSGVCYYEYFCMGGFDEIILLDQSLSKELPPSSIPHDIYPQFESRYRLPYHFPPPFPTQVPYSDTHVLDIIKIVHPEYLHEDNVHFIDGTPWISKAQGDWKNPYYFMKDNSIFWEIQWWNKTYNLNLPSMDYAFFLNHNIYSGWDNDLSSFLIPKNTQIFVDWNFEEYSDLSEDKPHCYKQAFIIGDKPQYWSGHEPAREFKNSLAEYLELPKDNELEFRNTPRNSNYIPRVYITDRRLSRSISNIDEVTKLCLYYKLNITMASDFSLGSSMKEQAYPLRYTDVYISVHGAGEANYMFLPENSSAIEIFPFEMKNMLYERHARTLGIHYFPVRSWIKPPYSKKTWTIFMDIFYEKCQNATAIEHNENECIRMVKNSDVYVPLREFEQTLIDAFRIQGIDITNRPESSKKRKYIETLPNGIKENDYYQEDNFIHPINKDLDPFLPACYVNEECYVP